MNHILNARYFLAQAIYASGAQNILPLDRMDSFSLLLNQWIFLSLSDGCTFTTSLAIFTFVLALLFHFPYLQNPLQR